jgi:hypothetical protein
MSGRQPLRVSELAEALAVDFDDVECIPRLISGWRWENQEQALQIAFSSLIAIVEAGDVEASDNDSKVLQFSSFLVLRNARGSSHKAVRQIRFESLFWRLGASRVQ